MGDARFRQHLRAIQDAPDRAAAIRSLDDDAVVEALAAASEQRDPYLANVLASEAMNRMRQSRAINRHLGEGVCVLDPEGRILAANPSAQRKLGWSERDLVGRDLHATVHYRDEQGRPIDRESCPLLRAIREGETVREESVFTRRDGTMFPAVYTATPILREGEIEGGVVVFRNVSEEKETERALRTSEARKRSVLQASLDAIIMIDGRSSVVEWNAAAERIFGIPAREALGKDMTDLIIPERYREAHRRGMARMVETGYGPVLGQRLDLPAIRGDGTEFPSELAIVAVDTPEGQMFTGYLRDVTRHKMAERRRDAEHRTSAILAANHGVDETLDQVMDAVGDALGWDVAGFWERDGAALRLVRDHVRGDPEAFEAFVALSRSMRFRPGEGLPGEAWAAGKPRWKTDVTKDPNFPRAPFARAAGLHGGVAFPVMVGDQPLGVLEFFCRQRRELEDPDLPPTLTTIGQQLGQFLERTRAERALRESEEGFRAAFDQAPVGMAHVTLDGRWLRVNRRFLEMLGYSHEELEGQRVSEAMHVDDREAWSRTDALLHGREEASRLQQRFLHRSGAAVEVDVTASLARGASGEPKHLVAVITERSHPAHPTNPSTDGP